MPTMTGRGDLGPGSKGMHRDRKNKIAIPSSVGEWTTTLDTTFFDDLPAAMTGACMVIVFVGLFEGDSRFFTTLLFKHGTEIKPGTERWEPMGDPGRGRVGYAGEENERRGDLQRMYSAPAPVLRGSADPDHGYRVVGLSTTLSLWRIRYGNTEKRVWRAFLPEPESAFRPHYY